MIKYYIRKGLMEMGQLLKFIVTKLVGLISTVYLNYNT